jgi:hypothetical protein
MTTKGRPPLPSFDRSPLHRNWNDDAQRISDWIEQSLWSHKSWTTYSFSYLKNPKRHVKDDEIIGGMFKLYSKIARHNKQPIYPLLWVSDTSKSLHFHATELHQGITTEQRESAFRAVFGKLLALPKDLSKQVIDHKEYDPTKGAVFYSAAGHNQLTTSIFKPRRAVLPLHLMNELDMEIRGQAQYIFKDELSFEEQLLQALK